MGIVTKLSVNIWGFYLFKKGGTPVLPEGGFVNTKNLMKCLKNTEIFSKICVPVFGLGDENLMLGVMGLSGKSTMCRPNSRYPH